MRGYIIARLRKSSGECRISFAFKAPAGSIRGYLLEFVIKALLRPVGVSSEKKGDARGET